MKFKDKLKKLKSDIDIMILWELSKFTHKNFKYEKEKLDYWERRPEIVQREGMGVDCDAYAGFIYDIAMLDWGFGGSSIRMAIFWKTEEKGTIAHMAILYYTKGERHNPVVIPSTRALCSKPTKLDKIKDWKLMISFNNTRTWRHA